VSKDTVKRVINSDTRYKDVEAEMFQMYQEHKHLTISIRPGKDRSALQNDLWAGMYKRIHQTLGWEFKHARAHCKLYCGIPILKRDVTGFAQAFDNQFGRFTEEQCLAMMSPNKLFPVDGFPVTRNFGTKQGCEYTDNIVDAFLGQVSFTDMLDET